jgi:methyl-CpG-binding domain protein 4
MERLIQEDLLDNPWKMTVACILLNQTTNQQVRKILYPLFDFLKSPANTAELSPSQIYPFVKSTGFGNLKSERIIKMSQKWISGFERVQELPGVGKYATESWQIFVEGRKDFVPSDKKLKMYLERFNN